MTSNYRGHDKTLRRVKEYRVIREGVYFLKGLRAGTSGTGKSLKTRIRRTHREDQIEC